MSLIIKGLHPVRSATGHASYPDCSPSPCDGLSPSPTTTEALPACAASRSHSLCICTHLPLLMRMDSNIPVRMPIAIFALACCKSPVPERPAMRSRSQRPGCRAPRPLNLTRLELAWSRTGTPIKSCRRWAQFAPQMRMNRFVFLILLILSFGLPVGLTTSPHSPFPAGSVTP